VKMYLIDLAVPRWCICTSMCNCTVPQWCSCNLMVKLYLDCEPLPRTVGVAYLVGLDVPPKC
jgi:hypothetical protein